MRAINPPSGNKCCVKPYKCDKNKYCIYLKKHYQSNN